MHLQRFFHHSHSLNQIGKMRLLLAATFLTLMPAAAFAQGTTTALILRGDTSPDGIGTFRSFGEPTINDLGEVAFDAFLDNTSQGEDNNAGVYRVGGGRVVTQIVREGDPAPRGTGVIDGFFEPALNDDGQVAFRGSVRGAGFDFNNQGRAFRGDGTDLIALAAQSDPALDNDGVFDGFGVVGIAASGETVFNTPLRDTSNVDSNEAILFGSSDGQSLSRVARLNRTPQGLTQRVTVFRSDPYINDAGDVLFQAEVGGFFGETVILRGDASGVTPIARAGNGVPGDSGVFSSFVVETPRPMNEAGSVAFTARLLGDADRDSGVYRGDGTQVTNIAREGSTTPGGAGVFDRFDEAVINDNDQVAFKAELRNTPGGSDDDLGVYIGEGTDVSTIVREGDVAPGGGNFETFMDVDIIDSGTVVFRADLRGQGEPAFGLFLADENEVIRIVGDGSELADFSDGEVDDIDSVIEARNRGGRRTINERGQVVFAAESIFGGPGNAGVFVFTPDLEWRSRSSGNWDESSNWTVGLRPDQPHAVEIIADVDVTVTGPSAANTTVDSLRVGGGTGDVTLELVDGDLATTGGTTIVEGSEIAFTAGGPVPLGGAVDNRGAIRVTAGSTAVLDGEVSGPGDVAGSGTVEFRGELDPGASPAAVTVEPESVFAQTARILIELGGTTPGEEHDKLSFQSALKLNDPMLEIALIDADDGPDVFVPEVGDRFHVFDLPTAVSGRFGNVIQPDLPPGMRLDLSNLLTTGEIHAVPEPTAATLFGLAALVGVTRRRMNRPRSVRRTPVPAGSGTIASVCR